MELDLIGPRLADHDNIGLVMRLTRASHTGETVEVFKPNACLVGCYLLFLRLMVHAVKPFSDLAFSWCWVYCL